MKVGKLPENVLKLSVLNQLHSKNKKVLCGASAGADCAVFELSDGELLTSCTAESELLTEESSTAYTGVDRAFRMTMRQLLIKWVNNLAAGGSRPVGVQISFFLPCGVEKDELRGWMKEADDVCEEFSMQIMGGQTRILEGISVPVAVVSGFGSISKEQYRERKLVLPAWDIVMSKWAGLQGTAVLAKMYQEKLKERYPAFLTENAKTFDRYLSVMKEAEIAVCCGAAVMHDASEGGIFGALWELGERLGMGFSVDLKRIPIRQETVEICEYCGVNPYELMSGGSLLMVTEDGDALVCALRKQEISAAVIGKTTEQKPRIIQNEDEIRYLDRPKQDEIFRICKGIA